MFDCSVDFEPLGNGFSDKFVPVADTELFTTASAANASSVFADDSASRTSRSFAVLSSSSILCLAAD